MSENSQSRRDFIKWLAVTGGCVSLTPYAAWSKKSTFTREAPDFLQKFGPVNYHIDPRDENHFFGDQPHLKAHPILWDKETFLKTNPLPSEHETAEIVIVGGGLSGIVSSYLLRHQKPLVLEQAPRFGGNSKAEVWKGLSYSMGAAYFMEQDPESEIYKLFKEVGVHSLCRWREEEDLKLHEGQFHHDFWSGEMDKENKKQYIKLAQFFKEMLNETEGRVYPEIPLPIAKYSEAPKKIEYLKDLDKMSLKDYLENVVLNKVKLAPLIEQALEKYFWSAFACSSAEISAAAGLNAYVAEFGKAYVAPGGNAKVVEQFLKKAMETVPAANFRTEALVVDVRVKDPDVFVTYSDSSGKLKTIKAKKVVMACPKFVVKKILQDLEPERLEVLNKLNYRSYLVANVLINKKTKDMYDFYLMDKTIRPEESQVSDVIVANFAERKKMSHTVLTLYRGFPFAAGRALLYAEDSFAKYKKEIEDQLHKEILPALNVKKTDVQGIRITRWGHPMPLSSPGLILDSSLEKIRKPFKKRVFFVEQDNWMLAALEVSVGEALFWCKEIQKLV